MKISRKIGLITMGVSLAGVAGFGAMLGIGANYTVKLETSEPGKAKEVIEVGVGSLNYTKMWENGVMEWRGPEEVPTKNNQPPSNPNAKPDYVSYRDYIKFLSNDPKIKTQRDEVKKNLDTIKNSGANQTEIDEAQFEYDLLEKPFLADNLMIAGAVLTTLFSAVALASIILVIFKTIKK